MKDEKKNEYIKTAKEICLSCYPSDEKEQWVSLSWLYDVITMEQSKKSNSLEYDNGLEFVLSLLEESK